MPSMRAQLLEPVTTIVRWPDGHVGAGWQMPAGQVVAVDAVDLVDEQWLLWVRPLDVDTPAVFALVDLDQVDTGATPPF
jgi:hypothetical protein